MCSLSLKLMLAFIVVSLIGAVLASVLARWITEQEFNRLVMEQAQNNFMNEVTAYYASRGSRAGVTEYFRQKAQVPQPRPANPNNPKPLPPREPDTRPSATMPIILIDQNGYVLHPVPPS